jgi:predicted metal-dependent hydrolase
MRFRHYDTIKAIEDKELGILRVFPHARAKNYTFRTDTEGIRITVPVGASVKSIQKAIDDLRPQLITLQNQQKTTFISPTYVIDSPHFKLKIHLSNVVTIQLRKKEEIFYICCPSSLDWKNSEVQTKVKASIVACMRLAAKAYLPFRLHELAQQHHFEYKQVRISSSKKRWGSCSSQKTINLSLFLMRLPTELIDYVLLHELTHLIEMNHGVEFWRHLDAMTQGQSQRFRKALKRYATSL